MSNKLFVHVEPENHFVGHTWPDYVEISRLPLEEGAHTTRAPSPWCRCRPAPRHQVQDAVPLSFKPARTWVWHQRPGTIACLVSAPPLRKPGVAVPARTRRCRSLSLRGTRLSA